MLVRSIIFYLLVYVWTILLGIVCLPYLVTPSSYLRNIANLWINGIFMLLKFICSISYEIVGLENIPKHAVIVASKHQFIFMTK